VIATVRGHAFSFALAGLLVLSNVGCRGRDAEADRAPPVPAPPAATASATSLATSQSAASVVRELHPLAGGPSCVEMYTVCDAQRRCTSASFFLDCGQSGALPSTGERLRCVCP
jgi:hypothetical protein